MRIFVVFLTIGALAFMAPAQEKAVHPANPLSENTSLPLIPQDTLKVKVDLVTVGVRVTDSRGDDVRGLKAEDFSVFDDGVPQKIRFFSNQEEPITLGIILDRSLSMVFNQKLERAKEAALALVRTSQEGSEYFYITFDENVRLAADFTNDPKRVESAIEQTTLGGGTSLYDAVMRGVALRARARLPRQALVIISDGGDQHSSLKLEDMIRGVRESEMQVFTIGYFRNEEERLLRPATLDGREIDDPRSVLQRLAKDSGAESFFPRSDAELVKAVDKIVHDLRSQYTVAFYPAPDSEKRYHQLRVTVRGGRYDVRARPGYSIIPSN